MKVIAAFGAFLCIPLASIFGTNASPTQTDLVITSFFILLFVAGTSLLLGIAFGTVAVMSLEEFKAYLNSEGGS